MYICMYLGGVYVCTQVLYLSLSHPEAFETGRVCGELQPEKKTLDQQLVTEGRLANTITHISLSRMQDSVRCMSETGN
jgi:hypothetical protein